MARSKPPNLTREILDDAAAMSAAVEKLLLANRTWKRHTAVILEIQAEMRTACSDEAWSAYLELEMATNARLGDALLAVARWGFRAGQAAGERCR